jgi:ABC-type Fe3+/spermidine/putrescine transport system ATPase subunit
MSDPLLTIRGLRKSYGEVEVLRGIDLEVGRGETVALLGPSGSGKTTLLRVLMGFEQGTGEVLLRGQRIDTVEPHRRGIGLVFQNYALFPHLDVRGNVTFGPRSLGWDRQRIESRLLELLRLVDLEGYAERKIGELSGGQQQRVALARALASGPDLLLLDEPLSNLDPDLRERTRGQLADALAQVETTCLLVTHEQDEAFELGDQVAVLSAGRLEQIDTPARLYGQPATAFVASFIGRSTMLEGWFANGGPAAASGEFAHLNLDLFEPDGGPRWTVRSPASPATGRHEFWSQGMRWQIWVRPEEWHVEPWGSAAELDQNVLGGIVRGVRFAGPLTFAKVVLEAGPTIEVASASVSAEQGTGAPTLGQKVGLRLADGACPVAFPAQHEAPHEASREGASVAPSWSK